MQKVYSTHEWCKAERLDPGLRGMAPLDAGRRLGLNEGEIGELMLKGYLDVSYIVNDYRETTSIVIPERAVQEYAKVRKVGAS